MPPPIEQRTAPSFNPASLNPELVRDALREVIDPELGHNIVDLGLVYGLEVREGIVDVTMTMTTRGCPAQDYILSGVQACCRVLPGAEKVRIHLVWEPPWSPRRMSAAARAQSGIAAAPTAPAIWTYAFRPFFIAAGIWAAIAVLLWVAVLLTGRTPPSRFDPLSWHIHEMLFGFVPAAIAGFLFTAIPTWTGRAPLKGAALAGLLGLWALGRLVCLWSAQLPWGVAASVDPAFELAVCVVAAREIVLARNWRNLVMPLPVAVLGIANLLMYLSLTTLPVPPSLGWRLGLAAIIVLISAVGGRIIPAFTQNWLAARGTKQTLPRATPLDRLAMAALHSGLLGWALFPHSRIIGTLLLLAAVLMGLRLMRWHAFATLAEPLLAILHLGYGWMIIGAAMLGGSILFHWLPLPAAIHALTIGAIGTMILGVMTRVSLGHTGRPLHAGRMTALIYSLISAAVLCRIAAAFPGSLYLPLILAASSFWVASFIVFAAEYGPMLTAPRIPASAAARSLRDAQTGR